MEQTNKQTSLSPKLYLVHPVLHSHRLIVRNGTNKQIYKQQEEVNHPQRFLDLIRIVMGKANAMAVSHVLGASEMRGQDGRGAMCFPMATIGPGGLRMNDRNGLPGAKISAPRDAFPARSFGISHGQGAISKRDTLEAGTRGAGGCTLGSRHVPGGNT